MLCNKRSIFDVPSFPLQLIVNSPNLSSVYFAEAIHAVYVLVGSLPLDKELKTKCLVV